MIYEVTIAGKVRKIDLERAGKGWRCKVDGLELPLDVSSTQNGVLSILINGKSYEVKQETTATASSVVIGSQHFTAVVIDPRSLRSRRGSGGAEEGVRKVIASMPGKVVRIIAPVGGSVKAGQGVLVIEAMKMQNEMKSPKAGIVKKINVVEGAPVEAGQVLAEVE
jgi:biotin carboxyl carrier protein